MTSAAPELDTLQVARDGQAHTSSVYGFGPSC